MTAPTPPPVVPAPPPAHTINVVAPTKALAVKAPAKTPIVGRPARSLPPGPVVAAAGTGTAAAGTGSWFAATVAGVPGFVGPAVLAAAGVGGVAAYRKFRSPAAKKRAGAGPRPQGPGTGRPSLVARLRGRGGQPAAGGRHAPRLSPGGGSTTSPGGRRRFGGLLGGGQRRPPAGGNGPAGGGRAGGGRLARLMPGARGRQARQAHAAGTRPASSPSSPGAARQSGPLSRVWARRPGAARRNARNAPGGTNGPAPAGSPSTAGSAPPRSRTARAWAKRPGGKRRAQAAAAKATLGAPPAKATGGTPKQHGPAAPGANRRAGAKPGITWRGPDGLLRGYGVGNPSPTTRPAAKAPPVPPAKKTAPPEVWSTRRKHRRNPAVPPPGDPVNPGTSLKTGKPHRPWNRRWGRTGSSADHIAKFRPNPPQADPGKGGGVGPTPDKPKGGPTGGPPVVTNPTDPARAAKVARGNAADDAAHWDGAARRFADAGNPRAALAAAARAAQARAEAERNGAAPEATPIPDARAARLAEIDRRNRTDVARARADPNQSAGGRIVDHGPGCVCDLCAGTFTQAERDRHAAAGPARRRKADLADSQWGPGGLREDPPNTDGHWDRHFRPGPEPDSTTARQASRDRWGQRTQGGTPMSGMNMREDWAPRLARVRAAFETAQAEAASLAADIDEGGHHAATKDGAAAIAAAAAKLAGTTDELNATSHAADATAHQFMEEKTPGETETWR